MMALQAFEGEDGNGGAPAIANSPARGIGLLSKVSRLAPLVLLPAIFLGYSAINSYVVAVSLVRQTAHHIVSQMSWIDGSGQRLTEALAEGASAHFQITQNIAVLKRLGGLTDGGEGTRLGRDGYLFFADNFKIPEDTSQGVDAGVQRISDALEVLGEHGTDVTIVILPSKAEIEQKHLFWPVFGDRAREARLALVERLQNRGVSVVDSFDAFMAAQAHGNATGPNDMHWTVEGARAVAQAVGAFMGKSVPSDISLVPGEMQMIQGDLAAAMAAGAPGISSEYFQSYPMQPYVAVHKDGVNLAPAFEDADTVVLGASSTQNEIFSFANFLRYELQEPIANMATWGRGPFHPMDLALRKFETSGHYPKKLIWEFSLIALFDQKQMRGALDEMEPVAPRP